MNTGGVESDLVCPKKGPADSKSSDLVCPKKGPAGVPDLVCPKKGPAGLKNISKNDSDKKRSKDPRIIDLNTCSKKSLKKVPGIGKILANNLVNHRTLTMEKIQTFDVFKGLWKEVTTKI